MVLPWLTLYVFKIIGISVALIFSCGVGEFKEIQPVSAVAIAFLIYFYVVVATFHAQLKSDEKKEVATADILGGTSAAPTDRPLANGGDHCLIALGGGEEYIATGGQGRFQYSVGFDNFFQISQLMLVRFMTKYWRDHNPIEQNSRTTPFPTWC